MPKKPTFLRRQYLLDEETIKDLAKIQVYFRLPSETATIRRVLADVRAMVEAIQAGGRVKVHLEDKEIAVLGQPLAVYPSSPTDVGARLQGKDSSVNS